MKKSERKGCCFRGAMLGYNKAEVDLYTARMEAELNIRESRLKKWTDEIDLLKKENERLSNIASSRADELHQLEGELSGKIEENGDLERQLREAQEETARVLAQLQDVKKRNEQLEQAAAAERAEALGSQKTIRDSLLAAQKVSGQVLAEVNQKAMELFRVYGRGQRKKAGAFAAVRNGTRKQ